MIAHDFLDDTDGDAKISNGDLAIGESDKQHIQDILYSAPGWWKQYPLVGLNPYRYINSKDTLQSLTNNVKGQLTADGYIKINSNISIDSAGRISGNVDAQRK